jgi:hypothetical protein
MESVWSLLVVALRRSTTRLLRASICPTQPKKACGRTAFSTKVARFGPCGSTRATGKPASVAAALSIVVSGADSVLVGAPDSDRIAAACPRASASRNTAAACRSRAADRLSPTGRITRSHTSTNVNKAAMASSSRFSRSVRPRHQIRTVSLIARAP